jgi:hypothetical protein
MARKRIRVADFRGEPAEIEFPDGSVYLVRGDFPVEVVTFMADLEERAPDADEEPDADEVDIFHGWLSEGHALLQRMVREGDPAQKDVELPSLSPHELMGIMGALIGGETVGLALAEALSAGLGEALERKRQAEKDPTKPKPRTGQRARKVKATA